MKKIGITTTVPFEILYAAGYQPFDLNNILATAQRPALYFEKAENDGFPKNLCAFIKGIYGVAVEHEIDQIVGVVEGDCSNTKAMLEVMASNGINAIPFGFPHSKLRDDMMRQMNQLMKTLNVDLESVEKVRQKLMPLRALAKEIDRLTYETHQATGFENHLFQVCMSDFFGDVDQCSTILNQKIDEIKARMPQPRHLRLAFIGVPPMVNDLYDFLEEKDARVVYNEVQHEFVFPRAEKARDIYEQYLDFTYPYDLNSRLDIIQQELEKRSIDGVIHYTQAFCYRAIEDINIKKMLSVPVIHIEGDQLQTLDARTKLRLEAFLDMLMDKKAGL